MSVLTTAETNKGFLKRLFMRKKPEVIFNWDLNPPTQDEIEDAARRAERKKERKRARRTSVGLASIAAFIAVTLTTEMVQKGYYQESMRFYGVNLHEWLMSVSVAVGLSTCIYIGFLMAERLSVTMERTSAFVAGWLCIFAFCPWAVCTSSWYAFMSSTGAPALEMHLNAQADKLDAAVEQATAQIKNARGMPTAMSAKAAGFATRGASEASGGGATGARGAGPVSQSLEGAAAVLETGATELRAAIEASDKVAAGMREKLREISAIANDRTTNIFDREEAFLKGASELRSMIGTMNSAGLGEMVRSTLAAVESAVSVMPTDGSKVGSRQAAAIEQTRMDMENIAGSLRKILDDLKGVEKTVGGSLVETTSLSQVVWEYKHNFKPALALAVGIDLFAVWALIFLGVHGLEEVRRREKQARVRGVLELSEKVGRHVFAGNALDTPQAPKVEEAVLSPEPVPEPEVEETPKPVRKRPGKKKKERA